jgi:hypothetical protein
MEYAAVISAFLPGGSIELKLRFEVLKAVSFSLSHSIYG